MKLTRDEQRKRVWTAIFKSAGDREKTASILGVSQRTLARYISDLDLHGDMEALGWKKNSGPPPGISRMAGGGIIQMRIVAHIKKHKGTVVYDELARDIYGQDTPGIRGRIYAALDQMKKNGNVSFDGETWRVLDKVG